MITICGASDDLIEVDGDLSEEFVYLDYAESKTGDLLGFSDGTLLRIRHDEEGIWRITPVVRGSATLTIHQAAAGDDDEYTDKATLSAALWVMHGTAFTKTGR